MANQPSQRRWRRLIRNAGLAALAVFAAFYGCRSAYFHSFLGGEALFGAVQQQDQAKVEALLREGAPVNEAFDGSITPLAAAIENDDQKIARLLLEHGADPNLPCDLGPPLRQARSKGMKELLRSFGAKP